jgi:hypothetical protein
MTLAEYQSQQPQAVRDEIERKATVLCQTGGYPMRKPTADTPGYAKATK